MVARAQFIWFAAIFLFFSLPRWNITCIIEFFFFLLLLYFVRIDPFIYEYQWTQKIFIFSSIVGWQNYNVGTESNCFCKNIEKYDWVLTLHLQNFGVLMCAMVRIMWYSVKAIKWIDAFHSAVDPFLFHCLFIFLFFFFLSYFPNISCWYCFCLLFSLLSLSILVN